jgi:hypothetical protein
MGRQDEPALTECAEEIERDRSQQDLWNSRNPTQFAELRQVLAKVFSRLSM